MVLFGGKINDDPASPYYTEQLKGSPFDDDYAYNCNFNDLMSSFSSLFLLMVELDADTILGFELVTNRWCLLFFYGFYTIGVLLGVNIVVAFILDSFIIEL